MSNEQPTTLGELLDWLDEDWGAEGNPWMHDVADRLRSVLSLSDDEVADHIAYVNRLERLIRRIAELKPYGYAEAFRLAQQEVARLDGRESAYSRNPSHTPLDTGRRTVRIEAERVAAKELEADWSET